MNTQDIERVIRVANRKIASLKDPATVKRLSAAVEIILDDAIYPIGNGFYRVSSRSREGVSYQVAWSRSAHDVNTPGSFPLFGYCECEDHSYRDIACAHRLAAWLLSEVSQEPQHEELKHPLYPDMPF